MSRHPIERQLRYAFAEAVARGVVERRPTAAEALVCAELVAHANRSSGEAWPTRGTLARATGTALINVRRNLAPLSAIGVLVGGRQVGRYKYVRQLDLAALEQLADAWEARVADTPNEPEGGAESHTPNEPEGGAGSHTPNEPEGGAGSHTPNESEGGAGLHPSGGCGVAPPHREEINELPTKSRLTTPSPQGEPFSTMTMREALLGSGLAAKLVPAAADVRFLDAVEAVVAAGWEPSVAAATIAGRIRARASFEQPRSPSYVIACLAGLAGEEPPPPPPAPLPDCGRCGNDRVVLSDEGAEPCPVCHPNRNRRRTDPTSEGEHAMTEPTGPESVSTGPAGCGRCAGVDRVRGTYWGERLCAGCRRTAAAEFDRDGWPPEPAGAA